jgi:hypothetical protein
MNAETAQALLRCYRPGKRVEGRMEKAVRVAEEDPELKKTLGEQVEFDEQIMGAIHCIKPPEDLRKKLSDLSEKPRAEQARLRKQVINPAVMTALFGVLVILGIVVFFVMDRMEKFQGREAVENMLVTAGKMNGMELEKVSSTTGQLGDWFYMRGYDGFEAPAELVALPVIGSRVFRVDGQTVAQIAVGNGDAANPELRCLLFQFHASEFGVQLPEEKDWRVLTHDEWVGAIRQHGDHCFLIAFRGAKADMQEFLKTLPKQS